MASNAPSVKNDHLELYAASLVMNTYLKILLFCAVLGLIGSLALSVWIFAWAKRQKPLVVRIDEVGRATVVDYSAFKYSPAPPEIRYFLAQFVQMHFGRMLGSVEERFGRSLFFVDAKLSQALIEEERKSHSIATFVREGTEEIDIEIKNIALQDLQARPMKANVDFEKVYFARGERREVRRERYAGYFEFVVQENVPNDFVLINPLGLTVTYFRTDPAFRQ